jgi:hypothetical protein
MALKRFNLAAVHISQRKLEHRRSVLRKNGRRTVASMARQCAQLTAMQTMYDWAQ